jgi:hypothetical protein
VTPELWSRRVWPTDSARSSAKSRPSTISPEPSRASPDHVAVEVEDRGFAPRLDPGHADLRNLRAAGEKPRSGDLRRDGPDAGNGLDQRQPCGGLGQRRGARARPRSVTVSTCPSGVDQHGRIGISASMVICEMSPTVRERMNSAKPPMSADMKMKMNTPTATPVTPEGPSAPCWPSGSGSQS